MANAATRRAQSRDEPRSPRATPALAAAKDANKQRQLLKSQLAAPPFDTMQADATAAATSAAATDAKAEIDANFPAELQAIAGKRYATRRGVHGAAPAGRRRCGDRAGRDARLNRRACRRRRTEGRTDFRHAEQALREYANDGEAALRPGCRRARRSAGDEERHEEHPDLLHRPGEARRRREQRAHDRGRKTPSRSMPTRKDVVHGATRRSTRRSSRRSAPTSTSWRPIRRSRRSAMRSAPRPPPSRPRRTRSSRAATRRCSTSGRSSCRTPPGAR